MTTKWRVMVEGLDLEKADWLAVKLEDAIERWDFRKEVHEAQRDLVLVVDYDIDND